MKNTLVYIFFCVLSVASNSLAGGTRVILQVGCIAHTPCVPVPVPVPVPLVIAAAQT